MLVTYIKPGNKKGEYLVVTEKGTFIYRTSSGTSEYQYLLSDFVYVEEDIIGII